MARLVLKFSSNVLSEIPIANLPLSIGRAPDNNIRIDEPSISDHHARLSLESGKLVIEDLGSLNGTRVNDQRIDRATLRDGDNIQIGQHVLQVDTVNEARISSVVTASMQTERQDLPNDELDKESPQKGKRPSGPQIASVEAGRSVPIDLSQAPRLRVLRGSTDRDEYVLLAKLTVIGSSEIALVKLQGWLAPAVGAQINHHPDGYYLGLGDVVPEVNGQPIQAPTLLRDGDVIQIGRVRLQFSAAAS